MARRGLGRGEKRKAGAMGELRMWRVCQFGLIALVANLNAMIDRVLHPEIAYLDPQHLITGGILALLTAGAFVVGARIRTINGAGREGAGRHKAAEIALEQIEQRHRSIVEASFDFISEADADGVCTYASPSVRNLGFSPEEFVGQSIVSRVHPDDLGKLAENRRRIGEPGRRNTGTSRVSDRDGNWRLMEYTNSVYETENGAIRYVACSRDITDAQRAEQTFQQLFEAGPDSQILLGPDGTINLANEILLQLFGYSRNELIGKHVEILAPDRYWNRYPKLLKKFFDEPVSHGFGIRVPRFAVRKDGAEFPVEINIHPLDQSDRPMMVVRIRDLTVRVRAEQEHRDLEAKLLQSQKLETLGVLAGGIAHDFNNLLAATLNYVRLVEAHVPTESPAQDHLKGVKLTAQRMAELVRALLAYADRGTLRTGPQDLSALVDETRQLLHASVPKTAILHYELVEELPTFDGDATQIHQVVMNLIINAAQSLEGEVGAVHVETGRLEADRELLARAYLADDVLPGPYVYFSVSDNGCGMDDSMLSQIFDPFYTTKSKGHGLGLAAVLGIVHRHRGAILVSSRLAEGSTFQLLLPQSEAAQSTRIAQAPQSSLAQTLKGTILLVDDEEIVRESAKLLLEDVGLEVITASDGEEAVELFGRWVDRIDLVILDHAMPKMSGEECLVEIRRIRNDVPFLMCSGYLIPGRIGELVGGDLVEFIQKPYEVKDLIGSVERLLS